MNFTTQVDEDNANISYANGGPRFHLALSLHSILASILVCMQKFRTLGKVLLGEKYTHGEKEREREEDK